MKLTLVIAAFAALFAVVSVAVQQSEGSRWQYDPAPTPTPVPRFQYDPAPSPTPAPRFQYDPGPTPTPVPRFQYDPTPSPTPNISPATNVAWTNPATGDSYFGSEVSTGSSAEASALASELDAQALRESGLLIRGEVRTFLGESSAWRTRAGVDAVYSASIDGRDGYVVVLHRGPRVYLIGVVNFHGDKIDGKAATDYIVGVADFGIRYRPSGGFVEAPHG